MMNIIANNLNFNFYFDFLIRTINNYGSNFKPCQNLTFPHQTTINQNGTTSYDDLHHTESILVKPQRDIESLLYPREEYDRVIIEIYDNTIMDIYNSSRIGYSGLPIGSGRCFFGLITWSRPNEFSDFDILYKGFQYTVDYKDLEYICKKIKIDFEYVIKTYIESNFDASATICYFLV